MFLSLFGAVESGLIYAIMALGVYLSFRIIDFPDLTVDGSFVTGGAVAAVSIINGVPPILATVYGAFAGFIAGTITGVLHTKGKINPLLSGILMMTALYSINLRIMANPQVPLLNETTLKTALTALWEKTGIDRVMNGMLEAARIGSFSKHLGNRFHHDLRRSYHQIDHRLFFKDGSRFGVACNGRQ